MSQIQLRSISATSTLRWSWLIITALLVVLVNLPVSPGHIVFDRMLVFVLIMGFVE